LPCLYPTRSLEWGLIQTPRIPLNHSCAATAYNSLAPNGKRHVMHKMNFEQTSPASRDIGGPSGTMLLLIAIVAFVTLALALHDRV
jgi:hypothetical protein